MQTSLCVEIHFRKTNIKQRVTVDKFWVALERLNMYLFYYCCLFGAKFLLLHLVKVFVSAKLYIPRLF